jgi:ferredoxin/flavodoxin---NADP+ reductase
MTYVITQNCCKDASCVAACPVNCIHPAPDEAGFSSEPMLYIDPQVCIDCGACADACPVDAAVPADVLGEAERIYLDMATRHFARAAPRVEAETGPLFRSWDRPGFDWSLPSDFRGLDVAVVGTGPAGLYAAELLLLHTRSTVTLIDRLPVAGGLIRYGVAPDHPGTKRVGTRLGRLYSHPRVRLLLGVEVGRDLPVEELAESFDAVVYAVGAATGRALEVPGEDLPGVHSGTQLVGWYNAHPDVPGDAVSLTGERAVVVGTGNVALDIARILSSDPDMLAHTDIADHALAALRESRVREVVLLGRRGPEHAAYSAPELLALCRIPGVELVVDDTDPRTGAAVDAAAAEEHAGLLRGVRRAALSLAAPPAPGRRIVLRFHSTVERVLGTAAADGVCLADGTEVLGSPVVSAIGYGGRAVDGLPFDPSTGTVPNESGRIDGVPGAYAVGWFKRGSSGGIGDNRVDAAETVRALLDDAVAGRLPSPSRTSRALRRVVQRANPHVLDTAGLERILRAENALGEASGRSTVKLATVEELRRAGRARPVTGGRHPLAP